MSTARKCLLTPAEYLVQESRCALFKSEFYQGETSAMAGASREHNLIVGNVVREMGFFSKAATVRSTRATCASRWAPRASTRTPDVTIVYGTPQFEDDQFDTLLNPTVLLEVLSESTEAYDRGMKSAHYRKPPPLMEYVLIAQDRPDVERYVGRPDGGWLLREAAGLDEAVELESVSVRLPMSEVYRQVTMKDDRPLKGNSSQAAR